MSTSLAPYLRASLLTLFAMSAFAGNSLLCRAALANTRIDAASFTMIRLLSGATTLWLFSLMRRGTATGKGSWLSAIALFAYAAGFSFAYIQLPASAGALLLFGAVQGTMIGNGWRRGERLHATQVAGLALAFGGLIVLVFPGLTAPPLAGSVLMLCAGIAWGIYSLRGRVPGNPVNVTAGNFLRAVPMALFLSLVLANRMSLDPEGIWYALLSGAIASGAGYVVWYAALPHLTSSTAATVQLSVPVIAALGGVLFLGEPLTGRFVAAAAAILGGIALVILYDWRNGTATRIAKIGIPGRSQSHGGFR